MEEYVCNFDLENINLDFTESPYVVFTKECVEKTMPNTMRCGLDYVFFNK